jgi:two-component system response regulator AtoC
MRQDSELLLLTGESLAEQATPLASTLGLSAKRAELGAELALDQRPVVLLLLELATADELAVAGRVLRQAQRVAPPLPVVLAGPAELARRAVEQGATWFLPTPVAASELARVLRAALSQDEAGLPAPAALVESALVGESKALSRVKDRIQRVAGGAATLLLRGESGTGKELVARAIHDASPRKDGPFMKVHCAALPDTLLESELFGYERGAFTGAHARKAGRVELAEGGTLFLDEIGDITPSMQVKLLRLLQDREFERLGGTQALTADVRFLAATHRDLEAMVKAGEFREDLFYRLNVVTIWLPPLRARREDIARLASRFCEQSAELNGRPGLLLEPAALMALTAMRWPGNVRQLKNFVERLVVLAEQQSIGPDDVKRAQTDETAHFSTQTQAPPLLSSLATDRDDAVLRPLGEEVRLAERRALLKALEHTAGNRVWAARVLGIGRATLYKKLAEHGIS